MFKYCFRKLLLFILFTNFSFAQEVPPINIYTTDDYGAENQNWAISQSPNKFIYIANNEGLLEFNGSKWHLYPTPNETIMRSVKVHQEKIFTGFYMDFGFWQRNNFGHLEFTSLVKAKDIEMLEDEQIWEILELQDWIVFKSLKRIYLYNIEKDSFKIIDSQNNITKLSKLENTIYFQELDKGIFMIENGVKKMVSDNQFLRENRIVEFFYRDERLYFLTQKNGFFYLHDNKVQKWQITSDQFLSNKTVYSAKQLKDGGIVIGTISYGLIKILKNGEFDYQITQSSGLSNNTILSIFEDIDQNIWLGLDNGINTINQTSPFQLFVKKNNFWGTIYTSIVFENKLFLGTNQGLYFKEINSKDDFKLIDKTQGQVWSLKEIDGTLFCSHDTGTYIIEKNQAKLISDIEGAWDVKKLDENSLIQGNYDGLYILSKDKNNNWSVRNKINGFENSSKYFIVKDSTHIFVNHEYKGVFKLTVDKDYREVTQIVKDSSVEKGIHSSLIEYKDNLYYACKKGVYKYKKQNDSFVYDSIYSQLMPKDKFLSAKLIYDKATKKLWSFTKEDIRYFTPGKLSNKPDLEIIPIKGSIHKGASGYENIIYLEEKNFLVGTTEGYLLVDLNKVTEPKGFYVNINNIYYNKIDETQKKINLNEFAEFENEENNLEFFYSVANYNKTSSVKYQYKLEGLSEKWSESSVNSSLFFENLSYGDYTFKVRALIDNKLSENIAEFSFNIKSPWYLSNIAISIYIIILLVMFYALHIASKRYYKRQREKLLENAERELELKELENSQKIIKLNNDKLRIDIENKNRELATSTMSIIKKNEFLNRIKSELLDSGKGSIDKVVKIIDKNLNNTDDWKMFQEAFNNADKKFLKKIKDKHPELTPNDLRLCAYLRLNLSSKEIAPLLNISPRSVEVKRYRLRKKMDLPHDVNLTNYIIDI